jgi:hypothetical protein
MTPLKRQRVLMAEGSTSHEDVGPIRVWLWESNGRGTGQEKGSEGNGTGGDACTEVPPISNTTPLQYKGPNAARDFNSHNFSYTQPKASI